MSHYPAAGIWTRCPACGRHVHQSQWGPWRQCPYCQAWQRLSATERVAQLADSGSFTALKSSVRSQDQLKFPNYATKLTQAQAKTGLDEAIITGWATFDTWPAMLMVMDSHFMMGTLNTTVTRKIIAALQQARQRRVPVVIVTASGGARMQEGLYALVGMNLILAELARFAAAKLPLVTVLTDPTMGGVSASFAFKGDVIVAEAGAKIGFAGARVIQQTMPTSLPDDFQSAPSLRAHGQLDAVVVRPQLRAYLINVLANYQQSGGPQHG
ncbi:acetyl-CoA carboxylase carboxyltransferase subunit beta [Lactiplantibacillus sp. WILCCON 0030]|uniref:Acetyl-coenzyme A carboxylase carboxyl transferase subunit beta n=1 Tax=Lactiplantibacillus brownii TaxID=3069269 RepID=A0ABU1A7T3_9LACO|nr:acetyl-CoA carboxylase carboxyltransferase subunit beta [Lactiplantibacillus brownii]MDQ7936498.1 acetyl-CoA carboxylase carboxyltransferase subunit beta [Lactiplantibacillus brownii]